MGKYTIQAGDTMSELLEKYGDGHTSLRALIAHNHIKDPNLIKVGTVIDLPGYEGDSGSSSPFWEAVQQTLDKINSREKFSYDLNGDALYQQYKDKYIQQGKMAMQDTMGQAAALTGGYGNSYAATAGNQAYQAHLNNLNDIIPELQQMAYDRYNQEGQDLLNQYNMAMDVYGTKYGEYRDAITDEQWQKAFDAQYGTVNGVVQNKPTYTGSTEDGKNYNNDGLTIAQVKELQNKLGVEPDGYYGSISSQAAGGLSAKEAYEKFVGKEKGDNTVKVTPTTRESAYNYAVSNGVPESHAASIMTATEWKRRRTSYLSSGQGGAEVKNYSSYNDYLAAITAYLIETYN
jgi:LysM repeat protein